MLDPSDIFDECCELEKELARQPAAELSQELQAKIMRSVHESLNPERPVPSSSRTWVRLSMASIPVAAAVTLIIAFSDNLQIAPTQLSHVVAEPTLNEELTSLNSQRSPTLPTAQHYRLTLIKSSADWESLLNREADLFEDLCDDSSTTKWRQGTSSLHDDD